MSNDRRPTNEDKRPSEITPPERIKGGFQPEKGERTPPPPPPNPKDD